MKWSCKIDWLTLTKSAVFAMPHGDNMNRYNAISIALSIFSQLFHRECEVEATKNNPFYEYAYKELVTGATVHIARDTRTQGVMLVLSGQVLDKVDDPSLFLSCAHICGWKCTRLDVAFDIIDSGYTIQQCYDGYCSLMPHTPRRKTAFVAGKNGDTFYIGSRSSAKMLRIYDKGRQQKLAVDWMRVEIELKDYAALVGATHAEKYPASLGKEIARLIDNPADVFAQICEDASEGDVTVRSTKPRTSSNRLVWLLNSVMPALKSLAREESGEYQVFIDALEKMESEVWNGRDDQQNVDTETDL